jgi:hypothetical protein
MIEIRNLRSNDFNYEWGLKQFVEKGHGFPNPNRNQDNTSNQLRTVTILGTRDPRERANIHFHYCQLCEENPSQGIPGDGSDSDHVGRGVYNIVISENKIWFYNRYKESKNPFTGMPEKTRWGVDFSVPYRNNR